MKIAKVIPIILAIFILNIIEKVNLITLKSTCKGCANPKFSPYASHHKKSTFDAISPNKPPITNPDNININNIQKLLSFVVILLPPDFHNENYIYYVCIIY